MRNFVGRKIVNFFGKDKIEKVFYQRSETGRKRIIASGGMDAPDRAGFRHVQGVRTHWGRHQNYGI